MSQPSSSSLSQPPATAWAPLRHTVYRSLWLAWMASNMAMWMHDVASAWVMATLTSDPLLVALVQTAATAPVFLFGLISGAIADFVNRRTYLLLTQMWLALVACILAATAATGLLGPATLLALSFASGVGLAMRWPVYSATVPEVVPRAEIGAALALNGVAMNICRILGPMLAGGIMAFAGATFVFAVNAGMSIVAALLILRWRPQPREQQAVRLRLWASVREGLRHVHESMAMRAVIVRTFVFFFGASALMALLPIVAKRLTPGSPLGFTLSLAAMGMGAILITMLLPRFRQTYTRDKVLTAGLVCYAVAIASVAIAPSLLWALPAMALSGAAWMISANSISLTAQLSLPNWVRARGMAIYQMGMMGSMAAGAAWWGLVASQTTVRTSMLSAAAAVIVMAWLCRRRALEPEVGMELS